MARPSLVFGPYAAPHCRPGDYLTCSYKRSQVEVAGMTDAPVSWPYYVLTAGKTLPFLTGELCKAVRTESVQAVAYHWGISRDTVRRWRRTLKVGRFTEGTSLLWRQLAGRRLSAAARKKGGHMKHRKEKT